MQQAELESLLLSLPGSEETFPFGPDTRVYKVMNKMFALGPIGEITSLNLKADPTDVDFLTDHFESVTRGYHMNKRHWITVQIGGDLPEEMLIDLIKGSYDLVAKKLKKADREKLAKLAADTTQD